MNDTENLLTPSYPNSQFLHCRLAELWGSLLAEHFKPFS